MTTNKKQLNKEGIEYETEERREHGCDGCHKDRPTERFDGLCGSRLWICQLCFNKLIKGELTNEK